MITLFGKESYKEEDILNEGLYLVMEFGKNWLQSIQERLGKRYPKLNTSKLDQYNRICQSAMKLGHDSMFKLAEKNGFEANIKELTKIVREKYPWVTDKNISKLYSQGMYYSMK